MKSITNPPTRCKGRTASQTSTVSARLGRFPPDPTAYSAMSAVPVVHITRAHSQYPSKPLPRIVRVVPREQLDDLERELQTLNAKPAAENKDQSQSSEQRARPKERVPTESPAQTVYQRRSVVVKGKLERGRDARDVRNESCHIRNLVVRGRLPLTSTSTAMAATILPTYENSEIANDYYSSRKVPDMRKKQRTTEHPVPLVSAHRPLSVCSPQPRHCRAIGAPCERFL